MNVTAQMVVLKSGNFGAEAGSKARQAAEAAFSGGTGSPSLPSGGALIPSAGAPGDGRSPARRYKASRRWQGDL